MKNNIHNSKASAIKFLLRNSGAVLCLMLLNLLAHSQTVTRAEYRFDEDKGFGENIQIPFNANNYSADSTWQLPLISTSSLTVGNHTLYLRTKDSFKRWSETIRMNIEITSAETETKDSIIAAEYFIDKEPNAGYGHGTSISITQQDSSISKLFAIPASALSNKSIGYHTLYGRVKNKFGRWGETFRERIEVVKNEDTNSVVKVEYFFADDSDLGFDKCHSQSITIAPTFNDSVTFTIPSNQFPSATHDSLFLRVREGTTNRWSQTNGGLSITIVPRLSQTIENTSFSIYPNPASNYINIEFEQNPKEPIVFTLTNVLGEIILQQNISNRSTSVNINEPDGIYFVKISTTKETVTRKIIIQN